MIFRTTLPMIHHPVNASSSFNSRLTFLALLTKLICFRCKYDFNNIPLFLNSCFCLYSGIKDARADKSKNRQWANSLLPCPTFLVGWEGGALQTARKLLFLRLFSTPYFRCIVHRLVNAACLPKVGFFLTYVSTYPVVARVAAKVVCQHSPRRGPACHTENIMLGLLEVEGGFANTAVFTINNSG